MNAEPLVVGLTLLSAGGIILGLAGLYCLRRRSQRWLPRTRWQWLALLGCLALLSTASPGLYFSLQLGRSLAPALEVKNEPAPDLTFTLVDGTEHRLEDWRGKILVLNFWATWCPPCREEMPLLERLSEEYETKDLAVVAVSDEPAPEVERYLSENPFRFPVGYLSGSTFLDDLDARPVTFLIDRNGVVREVKLGSMEYEDLVRLVEEYL